MNQQQAYARLELERWMRGSMADVLEHWQVNDWDTDTGEVEVLGIGQETIKVRIVERDEEGEKTGKVLAVARVKVEFVDSNSLLG